ncbi:MAG: bis(5'-nucleosyl)-tetraphosphatase (symmetrical) YqeK [Candidatus Goldbacteria bacterium]|nr:bis(5'-nucleosyl)-tetraphosphatase (symmetrical) YqeK [Candidatus Goldiibacteriota bacterium]
MVDKNNKIKRFNVLDFVDPGTIDKLKKITDKERYVHSLNVAKAAVSLAYRFKVNVRKAALAGILHDCAKMLPEGISKKYLDKLRADDLIKENPAIWHAWTGYLYAGEIFKIKDKEILNAIKNHTIGSEKMGKLAKIIYVADFTEDGRKYAESKRVARLLEKRNLSLDEMVIVVLKEKLSYLLKNNRKIHVNSLKLYNSLV